MKPTLVKNVKFVSYQVRLVIYSGGYKDEIKIKVSIHCTFACAKFFTERRSGKY